MPGREHRVGARQPGDRMLPGPACAAQTVDEEYYWPCSGLGIRDRAAVQRRCRRLHAYSPPCRRVPGGSPLGTRVHPELPRRNYRNARLRAVALTLSLQGRRVPGRLDCQPGITLRDRGRLAVVRGCSLGVQARADGYMARSTRVVKRWLSSMVLRQSDVFRGSASALSAGHLRRTAPVSLRPTGAGTQRAEFGIRSRSCL